MGEYVIGYQYGDDKSFIGEYRFHNNNDKEEIHLPPNTTLTPPPNDVPKGKEAAFDETTGEWFIRDENISWIDTDSINAMYQAGVVTSDQVIESV